MSAIKPGDWVVVAKPCPFCGSEEDLGTIFQVDNISPSDFPMSCCACTEETSTAYPEGDDEPGFPVETLRKMRGLDEWSEEELEQELELLA